jgi:hypothetical protein
MKLVIDSTISNHIKIPAQAFYWKGEDAEDDAEEEEAAAAQHGEFE